jgi:hypothetical protein
MINLKEEIKQYLKDYVHNAIVHPMMMFLPKDLANLLHDTNANWAFSKDRYDEIKIEEEMKAEKKTQRTQNSNKNEIL